MCITIYDVKCVLSLKRKTNNNCMANIKRHIKQQTKALYNIAMV